MSGSDWSITVRVKLANMLEHDHPDAKSIVLDLIREESLLNFTDLGPDDVEILALEPLYGKEEG